MYEYTNSRIRIFVTDSLFDTVILKPETFYCIYKATNLISFNMVENSSVLPVSSTWS